MTTKMARMQSIMFLTRQDAIQLVLNMVGMTSPFLHIESVCHQRGMPANALRKVGSYLSLRGSLSILMQQ